MIKDFPRLPDGRIDGSRLIIGCAGYIHDKAELDAQEDGSPVTCWRISDVVSAVRAEASVQSPESKGERLMAWQERASAAGWLPPEEVEKLRSEIERLRAGFNAICEGLEKGTCGDKDVVWFNTITTLWEFCAEFCDRQLPPEYLGKTASPKHDETENRT